MNQFNFFLKNLLQFFCTFTFLLTLAMFQRLMLWAKFVPTLDWKNIIEQDFLPLLRTGFLFDAQAIAYCLLPLFVVLIFSFFIQKKILFLRFSYFFIIILFSVILLFDYFFFLYFQTHFNHQALGILEIENLTSIIRFIWQEYPVFWILIGLFFYGWLIYLCLFWLEQKIIGLHLSFALPQKIGFIILYLPIYILALRGSVSTFPLHAKDKIISIYPWINELTPNGIFTFFDAVVDQYYLNFPLNPEFYLKENGFDTIEQVIEVLEGDQFSPQVAWQDQIQRQTQKNIFLTENPPHVVFLQMERFSTFYLELYERYHLPLLGRFEKFYPQFFQFKNFTSNCQGTLNTLLGQTAALRKSGISNTPYATVPYRTATARVFQNNGYRTQFVTSSKLGWHNIYYFLAAQGFDQVSGAEKILQTFPKLFEDPDWGVFDEGLFLLLTKELKNAKTPSFLYGMSTTHHPPFTLPYSLPDFYLPESIKELCVVDDISQKDFKTFFYATDQLGYFFEQLEHAGLLENTIIAITGDHTARDRIAKGKNYLIDQFRVPLLLYIPKKYQPDVDIDTTVWGSHWDIFPTLFELSLSEASYYKTGENMLKKTNKGFGFVDDLYFDTNGVFVAKNSFFSWQDGALMDDYKELSDPRYQKPFAYTALFNYLMAQDILEQKNKKLIK